MDFADRAERLREFAQAESQHVSEVLAEASQRAERLRAETAESNQRFDTHVRGIAGAVSKEWTFLHGDGLGVKSEECSLVDLLPLLDRFPALLVTSRVRNVTVRLTDAIHGAGDLAKAFKDKARVQQDLEKAEEEVANARDAGKKATAYCEAAQKCKELVTGAVELMDLGGRKYTVRELISFARRREINPDTMVQNGANVAKSVKDLTKSLELNAGCTQRLISECPLYHRITALKPFDPDSASWGWTVGGKRHGPFSIKDLRSWMASASFPSEGMVSHCSRPDQYIMLRDVLFCLELRSLGHLVTVGQPHKADEPSRRSPKKRASHSNGCIENDDGTGPRSSSPGKSTAKPFDPVDFINSLAKPRVRKVSYAQPGKKVIAQSTSPTSNIAKGKKPNTPHVKETEQREQKPEEGNVNSSVPVEAETEKPSPGPQKKTVLPFFEAAEQGKCKLAGEKKQRNRGRRGYRPGVGAMLKSPGGGQRLNNTKEVLPKEQMQSGRGKANPEGGRAANGEVWGSSKRKGKAREGKRSSLEADELDLSLAKKKRHKGNLESVSPKRPDSDGGGSSKRGVACEKDEKKMQVDQRGPEGSAHPSNNKDVKRTGEIRRNEAKPGCDVSEQNTEACTPTSADMEVARSPGGPPGKNMLEDSRIRRDDAGPSSPSKSTKTIGRASLSPSKCADHDRAVTVRRGEICAPSQGDLGKGKSDEACSTGEVTITDEGMHVSNRCEDAKLAIASRESSGHDTIQGGKDKIHANSEKPGTAARQGAVSSCAAKSGVAEAREAEVSKRESDGNAERGMSLDEPSKAGGSEKVEATTPHTPQCQSEQTNNEDLMEVDHQDDGELDDARISGEQDGAKGGQREGDLRRVSDAGQRDDMDVDVIDGKNAGGETTCTSPIDGKTSELTGRNTGSGLVASVAGPCAKSTETDGGEGREMESEGAVDNGSIESEQCVSLTTVTRTTLPDVPSEVTRSEVAAGASQKAGDSPANFVNSRSVRDDAGNASHAMSVDLGARANQDANLVEVASDSPGAPHRIETLMRDMKTPSVAATPSLGNSPVKPKREPRKNNNVAATAKPEVEKTVAATPSESERIKQVMSDMVTPAASPSGASAVPIEKTSPVEQQIPKVEVTQEDEKTPPPSSQSHAQARDEESTRGGNASHEGYNKKMSHCTSATPPPPPPNAQVASQASGARSQGVGGQGGKSLNEGEDEVEEKIESHAGGNAVESRGVGQAEGPPPLACEDEGNISDVPLSIRKESIARRSMSRSTEEKPKSVKRRVKQANRKRIPIVETRPSKPGPKTKRAIRYATPSATPSQRSLESSHGRRSSSNRPSYPSYQEATTATRKRSLEEAAMLDDFAAECLEEDSFESGNCARVLTIKSVMKRKRQKQATVVQEPPPSRSVDSNPPAPSKGETRSRALRIESRQVVRSDFADANKWKTTVSRGHTLRLGRSGVHAWGLFATDKIEPETFVIEYTGQVIRRVVAEMREKQYEAEGLGSSYLFRLDDEFVVDATKRGGLARFINHSCDPNCYTKIITVDGQKKIGIYSRRPIIENEELFYDYKFDYEEDGKRVTCHCGAKTCRGYMN
ncbi:hypothetical protein BSKO_10003 [Bryopsis sp. KO-2023]|nr:hypothetical protein BSKO_10003 [Bryopsis sp. KO-2023]